MCCIIPDFDLIFVFKYCIGRLIEGLRSVRERFLVQSICRCWNLAYCRVHARFIFLLFLLFCLENECRPPLVVCVVRPSGRKCPSALLVHEGTTDVNDNFRYATAHILAVRRENVEGVNVYNLLKYRQLVITEKALLKLIYNIEKYPEKRGWLPKYATPDGRPAPVPEKVEGWDREWQEKKERERTASYNRALLRERILKWKWSDETKGAMKVPRVDPFKGFRLARFSLHEPSMPWEKYGETYVDTEPLETEQDDFDAFDDLRESMEVRERLQRLDEEELPPSLVSDGLSPEDTPLNERRRTIPKDFYGEVPAEDDGKLVRPCQIKEGESVRLPDEGEEDSQWENCSSLPPVDRYSEKQRR